MSRVDPSLVSDAVVALIETQLDPTPVGNQVAKTRAGEEQENFDSLANGYVVISRVAGGNFLTPGFDDVPDNVRTVRYSISGYGIQANQAELLANAASSILLDRSSGTWTFDLVVPGHNVLRRLPVSDGFTDRVGRTFMSTTVVDLWIAAT